MCDDDAEEAHCFYAAALVTSLLGDTRRTHQLLYGWFASVQRRQPAMAPPPPVQLPLRAAPSQRMRTALVHAQRRTLLSAAALSGHGRRSGRRIASLMRLASAAAPGDADGGGGGVVEHAIEIVRTLLLEKPRLDICADQRNGVRVHLFGAEAGALGRFDECNLRPDELRLVRSLCDAVLRSHARHDGGSVCERDVGRNNVRACLRGGERVNDAVDAVLRRDALLEACCRSLHACSTALGVSLACASVLEAALLAAAARTDVRRAGYSSACLKVADAMSAW